MKLKRADDRPMKCDLCGSTNISTNRDVGYDIWPGGEEAQHIDVCEDCKATRFWCEVYTYECDEDGKYTAEEFVYADVFEKDEFTNTLIGIINKI